MFPPSSIGCVWSKLSWCDVAVVGSWVVAIVGSVLSGFRPSFRRTALILRRQDLSKEKGLGYDEQDVTTGSGWTAFRAGFFPGASPCCGLRA